MPLFLGVDSRNDSPQYGGNGGRVGGCAAHSPSPSFLQERPSFRPKGGIYSKFNTGAGDELRLVTGSWDSTQAELILKRNSQRFQ